MQLSTEDAKYFFEIMIPLLQFVNAQKGIFKNITTKEQFFKLSTEDKRKIRNALWDNPGLIGLYLTEGKHNLSQEEIEIVSKWKYFIRERFFLLQQLKKYAVMIGDKDRVYGVVGLFSSVEEAGNYPPMPAMINTVLLPFKGKIIYDGLVEWQSIYFGRGITSSLKETYQRAKLKDEIITTLEGSASEKPEKVKIIRDWSSAIGDIQASAAKLKGSNEIQNAVFALLRTSADMAQAANNTTRDDVSKIAEQERKVSRALRKIQKLIDVLGNYDYE